MKLWLLSGCGGLMSCVVRAATETDARALSLTAFYGVGEDWMDTCIELSYEGDTAVLLATDNRP